MQRLPATIRPRLLLAALVAAGAGASPAPARADAPVAGLVRLAVPPGASWDVASPFLPPDSAPSVDALFPSGLPAATDPASAVRVRRWDPATQRFESLWFVDDAWRDADGLSPVSPPSSTDPFRLVNATPSPVLLAFAGALPTSAVTRALAPGAHLLALPHPFLTDAPPDSLPLSEDDLFAVWNPALSEYRLLGDGDTGAWPLAAGTAFWYVNRRTNAVEWIVAPPAVLPAPSAPIVSLSPLPDGATARLSVGPMIGDAPADVVVLDDPAPGDAARPVWRPLARVAAGGVLDDPSLPPLPAAPLSSTRLYRAGPALDSDGDGLSDLLERLAFGTDPALADTDGDGIDDLFERLSGSDPLVAAAPSGFLETFEPAAVLPGPLHGQNGWSVDSPALAVVRTNAPISGTASLRFLRPADNSDTWTTATHPLEHSVHDVLWADARLFSGGMFAGKPAPTAIAVTVDYTGNLCVPVAAADGTLRWHPFPPARPPSPDTDSARVSLCFDFTSRTWIPLLDGLRVSAPLPMPPDFARPTQVIVTACVGGADDLVYSSVRPAGLSLDFDSLPDEWETRHFGSPDASGDADDADADGLDNLAEYRAGTDPLRPDTDADGLPDGWEAAHGLDPLDPADAPLDPDGDGRDNAAEYAGGSDPGVPDLPAALRAPGLRALLHVLPDTPSAIPDFASLAADAFAVLPAIDFPATAVPWLELENAVVAATALPDSSTFGLSDFWTLSAHGFLDIPADGTYALRLTSDDGSRLWLDGAVAIDNDGSHGMAARTASIPLSRGLHPMRIDYFEATGDAGLVLEWTPPGTDAPVPIPAANLCHDASENLPPQLRLAPPARPYVAGESVPLLAGAWDFDGAVARVDFLVGTNAPVSVLPDASGLSSITSTTEHTEYTESYPNRITPAVPRAGGFALDLQLGETEPPSLPVTAIAYDEAGAASAPATAALEVWPCPPGFDPGLAATYHPLATAPGALPDFAAFTNGVPAIEPQLAYAASTNPWPAFCRGADGSSAFLAPQDFSCFAASFDGALLVTEPGRHELALSSDDGSRLWLDGELVIDNDGDHSMRAVSASRVLAPGLHPIRVEYYNGRQDAGLVLSWTPPSATGSAPIPPHHLYHAVGPLDADGDGLPDWWEAAHGLDPSDPADAILDPDADGLTSLAEFLNGSDPNNPDTDNDGMPDAWEVANGTCPFLDDALDDLDGDGLSNLEEMRHGTAPNSADTDGDGVSDGVEVLNAHSDPLVADIAWGTPSTVGERTWGADYSTSTGAWRTDDDGSVYAAERSGSLTWTLTVPASGADALAVGIGQRNVFSQTATFDLSLYVDGLFVARQIVEAPYGNRKDTCFFLPEITSGDHTFRLVWRNWAVNTFLAVYDLRFVAFDGPDEDGDGIPDWKNHRMDAASALDALPLESLVSPLCVEGHDLWRDILEIEVATLETNQVYSTIKTIGDGFYVDIPLPTNGSAVVAMRDRSLSDAFQVEWSSLDVFAGEFATNALAIRTGDSLKIAPFDDEKSDVEICRAAGGSWFPVTNWTETAATPYRFDSAGLYLVSVTHPGLLSDDTAYALVDVVRSRFPKRNPAILMDASQTLSCPSLSPRNLLEHDSGLQVAAEIAGGGVDLSLLTHESRDLGLVSRLEEDGAISDAVQVTPIWADNGSYFRILDNYGDGSQLVEVSLLLGAIPEGTTVTLSIFVSGVTFEDGTRTMTLTAADFDENGHASIRFIRARGVTTSVCHATAIYQDGQLLYSNR